MRAVIALVALIHGGAWLAPCGLYAADATLRPAEGTKPNFTLADLTEATHDLQHLRGRVVLVHFFARWCEPCVPELTALRALRERYADPRLVMLAVDVGEVEDRLHRFFAKLPINSPVLLDSDRAVTKSWQVYGLPTTYVLDGKHQPRLVAEGDVDWADPLVVSRIDDLLAVGGTQEASIPQIDHLNDEKGG